MLLDGILALGLVLSAASQLRLAGNVGPGEVCLAIWILVVGAREAMRLGPPLTPALSRLLKFWIVFILALCLGTMSGYVIGDIHDRSLFLHDINAYGIVAAVGCLSVVEPGAVRRVHRVCWLLITLGAAWLMLQVAHGWGWVSLGNFDAWEWERFRGLSDNSNQLALFCTVVGLLSLYLADVASGAAERVAALGCMAVVIYVGRLTQSNAFLFALFAAAPLFGVLKLRTWLLARKRVPSFRFALAWVLVFALPVASLYVASAVASSGTDAEEVVREMMRGGTNNEADESAIQRFDLWKHAMQRGLQSGMLGLGPGPHLEIPLSLRSSNRDSDTPDWTTSLPQLTIVPNFEAHNTVFDLFVQGGLLAIGALAWLLASTVALTIRARLDSLTTLVCSVVVFGLFHFIIRHPVTWFAISLCLVVAVDACRAATNRVWT